MKKRTKLIVIELLMIIVLLGFYFYYVFERYPNNKICLEVVEIENSFCPSLEKEQCLYYENSSNSIPGVMIPPGGHCKWIEERGLCIGATGGCD